MLHTSTQLLSCQINPFGEHGRPRGCTSRELPEDLFVHACRCFLAAESHHIDCSFDMQHVLCIISLARECHMLLAVAHVVYFLYEVQEINLSWNYTALQGQSWGLTPQRPAALKLPSCLDAPSRKAPISLQAGHTSLADTCHRCMQH